jgi:pimeloyl-ACP methyl ester carboxylesterase
MKLFGVWMLAAASAFAATEVGELNGAAFRIDVPDDWSGILLVYCHGYSPQPGKYAADKPNPLAAFAVAQKAALIQSGYSAGGWAIAEALHDTEALRRYFVGKYGAPKETYVLGHSMGGFLTMAMMETKADVYHGGLALCGPLSAASDFMERHVFGMRVVFDYYFPEALPSPVRVPADFRNDKELSARIEALLETKPDAAASLRRMFSIRTNKELAGTLTFFTYILKDLQQRGGGNPFDNRDTIYEGSHDDDALNDGVRRYAADPRAADYVHRYYTPTGRLTRPLLHIHTTYDPLVPPGTPNRYAPLAEAAGSSQYFVQTYVKRAGHCAIQPQEIGLGLQRLRNWAASGERPAGGALR